MKKNKGFTLIELLAVIAILAIILLIAVPMVLSTIASSKTASAEKSAQFAWAAAELYIANQTIANGNIPATVEYTNYSPLLTGGAVTGGGFNVTNGQITGIRTTGTPTPVYLAVTSGGTPYSCLGLTKAAIKCTAL